MMSMSRSSLAGLAVLIVSIAAVTTVDAQDTARQGGMIQKGRERPNAAVVAPTSDLTRCDQGEAAACRSVEAG